MNNYIPNTKEEHFLSKATPKLELRNTRFPDWKGACGSGVVIKIWDVACLLTAAHNLTGLEPNGSQKGPVPPNEVTIAGFHKATGTFPLYSGENDPTLQETKRFVLNQGRDIAVLKLGRPYNQIAIDKSYIDPKDYAALKLGVGDTCFVVGYPSGIITETAEGILPIWKAATIASEPKHGYNAGILIDTWGEPGMSGGPVFQTEPDTDPHKTKRRIIGIYTGRKFTKESQSLGVVAPTEWLLELLTEPNKAKLFAP